jgi:hypothetical protein
VVGNINKSEQFREDHQANPKIINLRVRGVVRNTRGQSISISIGMLDRLIRTTLGLKRGAPTGAGPGAVAPLATLKCRLCLE